MWISSEIYVSNFDRIWVKDLSPSIHELFSPCWAAAAAGGAQRSPCYSREKRSSAKTTSDVHVPECICAKTCHFPCRKILVLSPFCTATSLVASNTFSVIHSRATFLRGLNPRCKIMPFYAVVMRVSGGFPKSLPLPLNGRYTLWVR